MKLSERLRKERKGWMAKKAKGFRGYPVGTVAFYGPDNQRATKAAVGVIAKEGDEAVMRRWFVAGDGDIRNDRNIAEEISAHLRDHGVRSVSMMKGIFGCPHEEGVDYPEGGFCPHCPYWKGRDRYTGELEAE